MVTSTSTSGSAFARRRRLHALIKEGDIGHRVVEELLPQGKPLTQEREMWDYKSKLPPYPGPPDQTEAEKKEHDFEVAGLIKDVVAFYNSYGGYLIVGVSDAPREVIGFSDTFDCDKFNRQVEAVVKHPIDCMFVHQQIDYGFGPKTIGLLFIPQRPDNVVPKHLVKAPPVKPNGKAAYEKNGLYLRKGDECKPVSTTEDYVFLISQGKRQIVDEPGPLVMALANNLRERDPGFIKFIGRGEYLKQLWEWLSDNYSTGKLLAGVGGVGKTTIVREFAEDVVRVPPHGLEYVIWFSAKRRYYIAASGEYKSSERVDFKDTESLLKAILLEYGYSPTEINEERSRAELEEEVIESLKTIPALVVVDDVDSLTVEEQNDVLHTMLKIMGRTFDKHGSSSRVIFTARLNLGVPKSQYIEVLGLPFDEFAEYVEMTANRMGMSWNLIRNSKLYRNFHKVSAGSPAFATSILRLVGYGTSLGEALRRWEGADGEEVRIFAFEKELDSLTNSQHRTLYALCMLGDTSQLEIQQVTENSETLVRDDLSVLSKYHLIATSGITPQGGSRLILPSWIQLMTDRVKRRVANPKKIEAACLRVRQHTPKAEGELGIHINRVLALWRDEAYDGALEASKQITILYPKHPDARCLLGRAYLLVKPPDANSADAAFQKADELNCQRVELFDLWMQAKKIRKDWMGILEITESKEINLPPIERYLARIEAYSRLGDNARKRKNPNLAQEYFLKGGQEANQALLLSQGLGYRDELTKFRYLHFYSYVESILHDYKDDGMSLDVWNAVLLASKHNVYQPELVAFGADNLSKWWQASTQQSVVSVTKMNMLSKQIEQLGKLIDKIKMTLSLDADQLEIMRWLEETQSSLSKSFETYR